VSAERELLQAVLEALTLPFEVDDYDRRILERARIARVVVREALAEDPARLAENVDFLRRKLRDEEVGR
jgi:hypothetical protein